MPKISHLIGIWYDEEINKTFNVRKALDRSNTYLSIEFSTVTKYLEPFSITSEFIFEARWERFNPEGFERLIQKWDLKKVEAVN